MLLGVAGPKGSGKDTFANRFQLFQPCLRRAFADPLKQVCKEMYLLSEEQLHDPEAKEQVDERWGLSPRQMFQRFGTDYVRNQVDENFWIKHFEMWYRQQPAGSNVIVTDVRFQNEVDLIHRLGGKVVYIYRPFNFEQKTPVDNHISETEALQLSGVDYHIDNCGSLQRFYQNIDSFVERLV